MAEEGKIWYRAEYHSLMIILLSGIAVCFLLWRGSLSHDYFIAYWIGAFIIFFVMILIFSVRMECDERNVYLTYGIGIMTTEFPIFVIAEAGPVKNDSVFSLPYNFKSKGALRIVLRDGKKFTIPADRPKEIAQALLTRAYQN